MYLLIKLYLIESNLLKLSLVSKSLIKLYLIKLSNQNSIKSQIMAAVMLHFKTAQCTCAHCQDFKILFSSAVRVNMYARMCLSESCGHMQPSICKYAGQDTWSTHSE